MMRTAIAILCLLAAAAPAGAISRYNAASMSCAEAHSRIRREGAVILRFRSTFNPSIPRFGRYVDSVRFCSTAEEAVGTSIPTKDTRSCPVRECQTVDFDDFDWWRHH